MRHAFYVMTRLYTRRRRLPSAASPRSSPLLFVVPFLLPYQRFDCPSTVSVASMGEETDHTAGTIGGVYAYGSGTVMKKEIMSFGRFCAATT